MRIRRVVENCLLCRYVDIAVVSSSAYLCIPNEIVVRRTKRFVAGLNGCRAGTICPSGAQNSVSPYEIVDGKRGRGRNGD